MRPGARRTWLALGAIVALGAGFRLWGITWGLHDAYVSTRPHPDEWVVYWLSQWFTQYHSLNPCPRASTACFLDWGTVFPYAAYAMSFLVAPIVAHLPQGAFGSGADQAFVTSVIAGRLVSVLASTATIPVAYAVGRRLAGTATGLLAALLVALSTLPIQLAHFATPDSITGLWMALTLLTCLRAMQEPSVRAFAIAGAVAGLGLGTEYHMLLLAVPIVTAWLLGRRERRFLLAAAAAGIAVVLVANIYALIDLPSFIAATEHTLRIRTVDSAAEYGDRWAAYGPSWLYVVRFPLGYGVGFALAVLMCAGVLWAFARHQREDVVLLSWCVPYFLLVTLVSAKFMRYSAPLLFPFAVFAARAAVAAVGNRQALRTVMVGVLTVATLYTASYDAAYAALFSRPDPRSVAAAWLTQHAPSHARIAFSELPNGLVNLPYFVTDRGFKPCVVQFDPLVLSAAQYVAVDTYSREDHSTFTTTQVDRYFAALEHTTRFQRVEAIHYVPSFLGMTFPIDGSPHDWRYPAHNITIYRLLKPSAPSTPPCYPTIGAATAALHVAAAS